MSSPSGNWNYPTSIRFGPGRVSELPLACQQLGIRHPLLITDPGLVDLAITARAVALNEEAGIPTAVFSQIKGNPVEQNVIEGVEALRGAGHDGVIAFGGGSALDAAKAVAMMAGQSRPLFDFEDREDWWTRVDPDGMAPVVAIPTTSGTGSEVGRASVIKDESDQSKKIIFHPQMLPAQVICDPELTLGLPAHITAATGMDALSHALEAWCAPGFHPMADGIALEAMRRVRLGLVRAVQDGSDIEARSHMMAASLMGATAFQKGLGAMHAIAHPVGALWDAHHGTINAVVMPFVLEFNRSAIEDRLDLMALMLDLPRGGAQSVIDWVHSLREELQIPRTLADLGPGLADIDTLVPLVLADPSGGTNPIALDEYGVKALLQACIRGSD